MGTYKIWRKKQWDKEESSLDILSEERRKIIQEVVGKYIISPGSQTNVNIGNFINHIKGIKRDNKNRGFGTPIFRLMCNPPKRKTTICHKWHDIKNPQLHILLVRT